MQENVGGADRALRLVAGPALIGLGYTLLEGRNGSTAGLLTMVAGVLTLESAITRVCPVNQLVGLDTAH